uniref:Lactamase_B domain-containing protein n=1 Tax=Onchocerca volvulus TaxID=6282 RepID=A0A8R1TY68_ONCVO
MPQSGVLIDGFIAIDKFPRDSAIEYYFLTHAHSDHYGAIDNKWNNGTIYCSPITAQVLPIVTHHSRSKRAGIRSHLIHPLNLNVWHHMNGFSVMLLDANHIPGSVMFLFEGDRISDSRILFTGDFRADIQLYQNIFAVSVLQERSLSKIYLDTTYINCTREEFPSREASAAEICHLLRELFFNDSKPVTIMVPKVGREQLLVDIAMEFKCKVWVDYVRFQIAGILGLNEYFTTEKAETSIWTCTRQNIRSILYDTDTYVIDASMLRHIKSNSVIKNKRMRYIEYSDHSSPNEIRDFLSQLSFTQIIGLSVQLSEKQTEELERLSLTGFNDVLIRTETDEGIDENELSALVSSDIRSRIGLACDHALRSVFDIEILQGQKEESSTINKSQLVIDKGNTIVSSGVTILEVAMPRNIEDTGLSNEIAAKSDEKLQRAGQEIKKNAENLLKAIDNEDDYIFNLIVKEITRTVNVENLATHICMELNNSENEEKDNLLHEFLNEMDISKEVENLDSFGEQYREAVNAVAKMRTGFSISVHDKNLPYNAQEHVVYDISRAPTSINIPLEWLNESEKTDEPIIIESE